MQSKKPIEKINEKSPDVVPLTLDTYLPDSVGEGFQRTFTTDSGLLAFGEHSAYLQLMEIERPLLSIPASTAFKPFHLTVSTYVWFGISAFLHCLYPVRFRYLGLRVTGDWNGKSASFHPSAFGVSFRATHAGSYYRAENGGRSWVGSMAAYVCGTDSHRRDV